MIKMLNRDKAIAFIAGDVSVTLYQLFIGDIIHDLGDFGLKVMSTVILGVFGGIAGMVGKDIYNHLKKRRMKNGGV